MMIFVVEIMGHGIAAFNAESKIAGEAFIGEEWFRSDLMALERDGKPLWDGKSEIYLRKHSLRKPINGAWLIAGLI